MLSSTRKIVRAPRAFASRDIGEHALEREGVEVPAAHLDDRAEAAVERAAARGLDDIHLAAEHRVAAEHARGAVRQGDLLSRQPAHRPVRVVDGPPTRSRHDRPAMRSSGARRSRARSSSRNVGLAFPAHDRVDAGVRVGVSVGGQARVVAADDDGDVGPPALDVRDQPERGPPLERHDRQADDVRRVRADERFHGLQHAALGEDQVGHRDRVVPIDVAGQRRQRAVRHADDDRRHVLERVRHGEEQDVH